ncbi:MAG: hypothetical protein DID92_2727744164 [Candidatus Nitrotoga sp. SPKER]|nr:MAG: hypothetical protein DID92_2727744164 [Candidatus Nitrotoga sp. SPKER]
MALRFVKFKTGGPNYEKSTLNDVLKSHIDNLLQIIPN